VSFHFDETVSSIKTKDEGVEIISNKGRYTCGKVIVSPGAWLPGLFPELNLPLVVARQVLYWFTIEDKTKRSFLPANLPVYIWEYEKGRIFYGFPDLGNGIKVAIHHEGKATDPDNLDREVSQEEMEEISKIIDQYWDGRVRLHKSSVCMYTNTPDEDFIIDFHPACSNIIIASPCSGHGFKFSSAIGRILSEMATDRPLSFDISPFGMGRILKK
jgi:sarcosine oxidase